jgi:MFS family permease
MWTADRRGCFGATFSNPEPPSDAATNIGAAMQLAQVCACAARGSAECACHPPTESPRASAQTARSNRESLLPLRRDARSKSQWLVWACVVTVSVASSVQCGFGLGSFNNLDVLVPAGLAEEHLWLKSRQWALIVAGFGMGGFAGALVGTHLLRSRFKAALLLACVLTFASSAVLMLCYRWDQLLTGRVLLGLSSGISTSVFPLYYAAVTPPAVGAVVGTTHRLGLVAGIVASHALTTPSLSPLATLTLWRYVLLLPVCCAALGLGVLPGCPDDPRGVRASRGSGAALDLLAQLHGSQEAAAHLDALRAEAPETDGAGSLSVGELIASTRLRPKLVAGARGKRGGRG